MSLTASKARGGNRAGNETKAGADASSNDANVRQVKLKPIIKEVAEEVEGMWERPSIPCWGVLYTTEHIENCGG